MPDIELYSLRDNEVQQKGGLNWGLSNGNVCTADAYIALTTKFFAKNPNFFPTHGSVITVTWDDSTKMELSLEGTQTIDGVIYPKNLASANDKSILGEYIRGRMGIDLDHLITLSDLDRYGRRTVTVSKREDCSYNFDIHV